jgi:hypothetical protein
MTRPSWALSAMAAFLAAAALTGCAGSSAPAAGRLVVHGQAELNRPGEDRRDVSGSRDLKFGDRIRIRDGTAEIRLPDDRRLELRTGSDVELQPSADKAARPLLLAGDLLVVSGNAPLVVGLTGSEVAVQGDARVSRGVALLVASYKGTAQLSADGATLTVPALRQAALPATGQFPSKVTPLEVLPDDAWDQRYLAEAIDLSTRLMARSDGFTAQVPANEGRSLQYFRDLFPQLAAEPAFTAPLVSATRAPGETLVGAAITLAGKRATFAERWSSVFAFRDAGAAWGLVALDQGVDRVPVLDLVESALRRGPAEFAAGPTAGTPNSLPRPTGGPATTAVPTTTSTTVRPRAGGTTTTTMPRTGPTTTSTTVVGPLNTGSPLIDDTINSLVNTLTGLLNSLGGK